MSNYTSDQEKEASSRQGDVTEAVQLLREAITSSGEAIDDLGKVLDPIILDAPEDSMKSVAKGTQSRSPLADELQESIARIHSQRRLIERFAEMIQL